jgi:T4 RnlA family RNA ligase
VQNVDLSVGGVVNDKLDGSLMSTFWYMDINGVIQLGVKSKMSLISDQCVQTTEYLQQHPILRQELLDLARKGFTVYCEICGPDNRIVVGYQERKLTALGIRDNTTGEELPPTTSSILSNGHWVNHFYSDDIASVVSGIDDLVGIEGYVIQLNSGIRFKIKSNWYLSLHHCKDSVNNPRRLFEVIVDEGIDDIRSMFHDDAWLIKQINEMQLKVDKLYNDMVNEVEKFYEFHKDLDRKTYAILGQTVVTKLYFSLVMEKYKGNTPDYKTFLKSRYKELGFVDKSVKGDVSE